MRSTWCQALVKHVSESILGVLANTLKSEELCPAEGMIVVEINMKPQRVINSVLFFCNVIRSAIITVLHTTALLVLTKQPSCLPQDREQCIIPALHFTLVTFSLPGPVPTPALLVPDIPGPSPRTDWTLPGRYRERTGRSSETTP